MSQDNRLLSLSSAESQLDRPLRDLSAQSVSLPAPAPSSPFFDQAQLRHYLRIVLKRKWLILGLAVIITSLVTVQMYRLPNVFEAETMIQIEPKRSVLQTQQLMINSANYDPNYWSTQLALLTNPQLARQVVLALDLQNNSAFLSGQATPSVLSSIKKVFSGGKAKPTTQNNLPVVTDSDVDVDHLTPEQLDALEPYEGVISANLMVNPLKDTNLVDLSFRHNDPEIAAKVANTLAEAFIANDVRRETKGSDRASDILARNIIDLQMKIKQGEEERINYLKNHNLPLGSGAGQNLTSERLGLVSGQLLAAENERKNAQAVYEGRKRRRRVVDSRSAGRCTHRRVARQNRRAGRKKSGHAGHLHHRMARGEKARRANQAHQPRPRPRSARDSPIFENALRSGPREGEKTRARLRR
ncbi:MAG: Wzz/FepE/Etk N-terminal domain-containing protein [Pyrinomonadaceae bacterium]